VKGGADCGRRDGVLLNVLIVIKSQRRKLARKEAAMLDVAEWTNNKSRGSLTSVCLSVYLYVFCRIVYRGAQYVYWGTFIVHFVESTFYKEKTDVPSKY
jgi:hypothetical protein